MNAQDGQINAGSMAERFSFIQLKISPSTNEEYKEYSIGDVMKKFNHKFIDFFKIDIEGTVFTSVLLYVQVSTILIVLNSTQTENLGMMTESDSFFSGIR